MRAVSVDPRARDRKESGAPTRSVDSHPWRTSRLRARLLPALGNLGFDPAVDLGLDKPDDRSAAVGALPDRDGFRKFPSGYSLIDRRASLTGPGYDLADPDDSRWVLVHCDAD